MTLSGFDYNEANSAKLFKNWKVNRKAPETGKQITPDHIHFGLYLDLSKSQFDCRRSKNAKSLLIGHLFKNRKEWSI